MNKWKNINIKELYIDDSWKPLFNKLMEDKRFELIEKFLSENKINIYPYPNNLFYAFNIIPINKVNTIILGQDPYHNSYNNEPQAMGLSFSVDKDISLPSSLKNIFNNMKKFNHIKDIPLNGDLTYLAKQGCLLMNCSLSVLENKPNSHNNLWYWFTNDIIKYLSDNFENLIFVLWGLVAYKKLSYIDTTKHKIIISSHPSGLSNTRPMKAYPAFSDNDHFGQINEYLEELNKPKLIYENHN